MTDHLTPRAKKVLELPIDERVKFVLADRWIGYPSANRLIERLEDLLVYPRVQRMPNLLISGPTNNGKSTIVREFLRRHPPSEEADEAASVVPILAIETPPVPDEGRLYNAILEALFAPFKESDSPARKQIQAARCCRAVGLQVLVLDDIHRWLRGTPAKQAVCLSTLWYLCNELRIAIVAVGTREAHRVIATDPQLANRFEPFGLPKWPLDKHYLRLLASFERMLPLANTSNLSAKEMAIRLHALTDGTIGELANLLKRCAVYAIRRGTERIDDRAIAAVDWTSPAKRRDESHIAG